MKKKFIERSSLLLFGLCIALCSCDTSAAFDSTGSSAQNDDNVAVTTVDLPLINLSDDFSLTNNRLKTFYIRDSVVPYVDVLDFVKSLDGFIQCGDTLRYQYQSNSNRFWLGYYYKGNLSSYAEFRWSANEIYVSDFDFFSHITADSNKTNYSSFLSYTDYRSWYEKDVTFQIGTYGFDILYNKGRCLIPFVVANVLFCSQNQFNLFYNGSSYYGYYGEINRHDAEYGTIYQNRDKALAQTQDVREAAVASLMFVMDSFYGLKKDKGIQRFQDFVSEEDLTLLMSLDPDDNQRALRNILINQLDELHTRIDGWNIYSSQYESAPYDQEDYGDFWNRYYDLRKQQSELRDEVAPVRYCDDTAIITLNSFLTGANEDLLDSQGNVKDTAWKVDSYYFMRHCMEEISKHSEVQDVVLDLSLNGGGNIGAEMRVLGFLTDKVIHNYRFNCLTGEYSRSSFKVDTDGDGYYDDDAYDQYRWTVLSSLNTFSTANDFVCRVKQQGLAKVIGNKSGGGMCSVLPLVLADGTPIAISSQSSSRYVRRDSGGDSYLSIEHGLKPDMFLAYSDFYDDAKIVECVDIVHA